MKFFYKRNLTFDEKVIFSCYSSCENNSKYILHSQQLVQQKVFCFCFFPVDYTRLLTLRTFQKRRFWSWTWVLPNSRNVKPSSNMTSNVHSIGCWNSVKSDKRRNQTWEILLLVTVVTVSFPQMNIRTKTRFHRFSNVRIMVTFVTLDLYIPVYQIEFISCWILLKFTTVL